MFPETFLSQPAAYFEWSTEEKIEQKKCSSSYADIWTLNLQCCQCYKFRNDWLIDGHNYGFWNSAFKIYCFVWYVMFVSGAQLDYYAAAAAESDCDLGKIKEK